MMIAVMAADIILGKQPLKAEKVEFYRNQAEANILLIFAVRIALTDLAMY